MEGVKWMLKKEEIVSGNFKIKKWSLHFNDKSSLDLVIYPNTYYLYKNCINGEMRNNFKDKFNPIEAKRFVENMEGFYGSTINLRGELLVKIIQDKK